MGSRDRNLSHIFMRKMDRRVFSPEGGLQVTFLGLLILAWMTDLSGDHIVFWAVDSGRGNRRGRLRCGFEPWIKTASCPLESLLSLLREDREPPSCALYFPAVLPVRGGQRGM